MQSRHCVSASPTTNERTHTYLRNSSTERRECKPGGQPHAPRTFEHARRSELSRDAPCGPLFAAPAVSPARTATSLTHSSAWQHQCGRKDWHCHATLHAGHCSPPPRCLRHAQPRHSLTRPHGNINVGGRIGTVTRRSMRATVRRALGVASKHSHVAHSLVCMATSMWENGLAAQLFAPERVRPFCPRTSHVRTCACGVGALSVAG